MKWNCTKYPDCKTWTVFDSHQTIASKLSREHAEQIVREHNGHEQLVAACKEVREACAIQIDGLQALMAITQPVKPTATTVLDVVEGLQISEAKLLNALKAAKGGDPNQ